MIFDGKPTSQITVAEIAAIVHGRVAEDQYVDFKARPYPSGDAGTHELIKDVTAFANAAGGYLIVGIGEDGESRANALVNVEAPESVRRSMMDRCLARIEPRLPELDIRIYSVNGNSVVICRVPDSPLKPHCAQPDREHHYFWKRYVDGNKLMTLAEIREAIQGDAVQREVVALRQELERGRLQQAVAIELEREVNEHQLLQLETPQALAHHTEQVFLELVGDRPFFRLTATPIPPTGKDIRNHRDALVQLLTSPPVYRRSGFDVGIRRLHPDIQQSDVGLATGMLDYKHLRLLWNGHLEFWHPADGDWISWAMGQNQPAATRPFNPLVLAESTASFIRLAQAVWSVGGISGEADFQFALHRVRGRRIPPYADNTYGRLSGTPAMLANENIGALQEDDMRIGPVRERIENLTGTVAFRLISELYHRLGYSREEIPYFTDDDRFIYDARLEDPQAEVGGEG